MFFPPETAGHSRCYEPVHCRGGAPRNHSPTTLVFCPAPTESNVEGHPCKHADSLSDLAAGILCARCPGHQKMQSASALPWILTAWLSVALVTPDSSIGRSTAWFLGRIQMILVTLLGSSTLSPTQYHSGTNITVTICGCVVSHSKSTSIILSHSML